MVLFTDGLVEERHVSLDVGLTALCHVLQEDVVSPERLCDRLLEAMFSDRAQEDDVAIVVLHRLDIAGTGPGADQDHPIIRHPGMSQLLTRPPVRCREQRG
jgi:Stage II sporulation protein E (SpoIIE)